VKGLVKGEVTGSRQILPSIKGCRKRRPVFADFTVTCRLPLPTRPTTSATTEVETSRCNSSTPRTQYKKVLWRFLVALLKPLILFAPLSYGTWMRTSWLWAYGDQR